MKPNTAIRLIAKQVYDLWQKYRVKNGDVPAKKYTALEFGIKTTDVTKCIKYFEKGGMKLPFSAKEFTGKVSRADCDLLWAKAVKARAGYKCEKSGQTNELQAHHIIPRTNYALRWDLENGVCLTKYEHLFWAHHDGVAFAKWIATKRDLKYLESKRNNRTRQDYSAIALYLTEKIKEFNQNKAG